MMQSFGLTVQLLILLGVANGAPVIVARLLGARWNRPVDGGVMLSDGRPLFGHSKTLRGLIAAVTATSVSALALGHAWEVGALFGAGAMVGDLCSSFVKRRLAIPPSGQAVGLDQVPEALFPLLACYGYFGLDPVAVVIVVVLFMAASLVASPVLFRLGVRKQPH